MIPVTRLLYGLDLKLNKVASNAHQTIERSDKLLALIEAQNRLVKKKVSGNNVYGIGLDGFKKRYQDLQKLIVPFEKVLATATSETRRSYQTDITTLAEQYMFPIEIYCTCSRGKCKNRPVYIKGLTKHGDLHVTENNSHSSPSFMWQETIAQVTSDKLIIYTNDIDGAFSVDNVYISYLRYPKKLAIAGDVDFEGNTITSNQDCELEEYLEDELLDLAALELSIQTENIPQIQSHQLREKNNE